MTDIGVLVAGGSAQQRRHRKQVPLSAEYVVDRMSVHMIVNVKQLMHHTQTPLLAASS